VDYITRQEKDEQVARGRIADLKNLPIQWIHSDESLCAVAATLKAGHRISFADAFVAATALRCNAILVHKDPEFLQVGQGLRQLALPPKQ
jgi:predicted nucleic acid-binding protein